VIHRVRNVYYPNSAPIQELKFWPDIWHDIKFTMWALFLNMLVLPLYLFGIGFVVSIVLNGYLLGREFFESAAGYYLGKPKAKELGRQNIRVVYGGGIVITLMTLAIPEFSASFSISESLLTSKRSRKCKITSS